MKFSTMRKRVAHAERLMQQRSGETHARWSELCQAWREGWTPLRILASGLGVGFITGCSEPHVLLGTLTGKLAGLSKLLEIVSTLSTLLTAGTQQGREQDECAASHPDAGACASTPRARGESDAPQPAEAATELSEH